MTWYIYGLQVLGGGAGGEGGSKQSRSLPGAGFMKLKSLCMLLTTVTIYVKTDMLKDAFR